MFTSQIIIIDRKEITEKAAKAILAANCTTWIEASESVFCYFDQLEAEAEGTKCLQALINKIRSYAEAEGINSSELEYFKLMILF